MNDTTQNTPEDNKDQTEATQEPAAQPDTDQPESQDDAPQGASDSAALEKEVGELKDRLMRAMAETENVRRRAERDKQDASAYAITGFARDVLNVADNLRRTITALPEDLQANEAVKSFIEGVELTERELLNSLERHGIRKVEPEPGERLDPNTHQAMFEVETTDHPAGTVVQVVQAGYVIKDRLLRPAMVGVAKKPTDQPESVDTTA